jgi:hypothetical protein
MALRVGGLLLLACCLIQGQSARSSPVSEQPNPAAQIPTGRSIASCPAGGPLGAVDLRVESPRGGEPLPFRTINHLSEGDTLLYSPIVQGKEKRPGEIALVLVPAKRDKKEDAILVTDPKPADKPQQWKITQTISLAAFVYGPAGLSKKKVKSFLSQDELLIAQLADYADKTAQAEALVAALSNSDSSSANVNAALSGFASQYGFAVQLDRTAPAAAQAETLFAAMNPQLATYNPLASSTATRAGQTASLATVAATLFFGSPVGLAAGGTAMLLDLRAIAFPDTQFRASFAQPLPDSGLNLCGQQGPNPPRTRAAYIWASRIPNTSTPSIRIGHGNYIPQGQKSPVRVDVPEPEWKYIQRAHKWALEDNQKRKTPVTVLKLGNQKSLEISLTNANLPAGEYRLTGYWDWAAFEAAGEVHVRPLSEFERARLEPASQDQLLAKSGKLPLTLTGSDFEFTTKVEFKKANDEFATPEPVKFLLPKGLREGPQDHMHVQIDTHDLDPGNYELLVSQQDEKSHPVKFKILTNPPKIENLPILANQGVAKQHYVLKGERLALVAKLEAPGAILDLSPASADESERNVTVQFEASPQPGTVLPVKAYVADRSEPVTLPNALQITGPLPVIASSKLSLPPGIPVEIRSDEFPAGYTLTAMLDVKNIERKSVLRLGCADDVEDIAALRVGEQRADWNLQQLSQDQLFLSFDTSAVPAGCSLTGTIDNGREGKSQPFMLAHIIRLPRIESFTITGAAAENGGHSYLLRGHNLEMIEKAGWDVNSGVNITGLPIPIPEQGQKQSLQASLPDPQNAQAVLYVWLRGDKQGRATTIKSPALPAPAPAITGAPATNDPTHNTPGTSP